MKPKLVYRLRATCPRDSDDPVGFFAREDRIAFVDRIWFAIKNATTWREFRELLPEGEFESLPFWDCHSGEHIYRDGDRYFFFQGETADSFLESIVEAGQDMDDYVVNADSPLDPLSLPAVCDGDYPPFLEPEQGGFLPRDFCDAYGAWVSSFNSGSWWEFPLSRFAEMKVDLESRGFEVADQSRHD